MEKEINKIIIDLSKQEMHKEKNVILDSIDLLSEELENIKKNIKDQMHICVDEDNLEKLSELQTLKVNILSLQKELESFSIFRPNKVYTSDVEVAETEKSLKRKDEIKLDIDLHFYRPTKIRIGEKEYPLSKNQWTILAETVCDIFAGKDKDKFLDFAKIFNQKKWQSICFIESNINNDGKIYHIKPANIYLQRSADANTIGKFLLELIDYFGYKNNYGVYVIKTVKEKKDDIAEINNEEIPKENLGININTKVRHSKFGVGKVVRIDKEADGCIFVRFENNVEKAFKKSFVNKDLFEVV